MASETCKELGLGRGTSHITAAVNYYSSHIKAIANGITRVQRNATGAEDKK